MSITTQPSFAARGGAAITQPLQRTGPATMHSRKKKTLHSGESTRSTEAERLSQSVVTFTCADAKKITEQIQSLQKAIESVEKSNLNEYNKTVGGHLKDFFAAIGYKYATVADKNGLKKAKDDVARLVKEKIPPSLLQEILRYLDINSDLSIDTLAGRFDAKHLSPLKAVQAALSDDESKSQLGNLISRIEHNLKHSDPAHAPAGGGGGGVQRADVERLIKENREGAFRMPAKVGIGAMALGLLASLWAAITGNQNAEQLKQQVAQQAQGQQRLVSVLQQLAPALDQIQQQIQSIQQKASAQVRALANALSSLSQTVIATSSPPTSNMKVTHSAHSMRSSAMYAGQPPAPPAMVQPAAPDGSGQQADSDDEAVKKAIQLSQQAQQALQQQAAAKAAQPPPVSSLLGPAPSAQQAAGPSVYAPPWQQPPAQPQFQFVGGIPPGPGGGVYRITYDLSGGDHKDKQ